MDEQSECADFPVSFGLFQHHYAIYRHFHNRSSTYPERVHYVIYNYIQDKVSNVVSVVDSMSYRFINGWQTDALSHGTKKPDNAITLATFATPDRLRTLKYIMERWQGQSCLRQL
jgi:hypothetical protein